MRRALTVGLAAGSLWLAPAPSSAQPLGAATRTVLAAVVDVNRQGRPMVDLGVDDFVVSEAGAPRDVLDVHVADYPVAVIVDDRPELAAGIDAVRDGARRFIQRAGERPVTLVRLTDGAHPLASLDDERSTVLARLAGLAAGTVAATEPLDTISRAASALKDTGAPFSAVIVIAAGPVDASVLVRGELLPLILGSGAAVHVVQVRAPDTTAGGSTAEADLLRVVADQTKGQFTTIFSTASFDAALDRLADRLAIEMMVQYLASPGAATGDVRVGVRVPGARVVGLGVR